MSAAADTSSETVSSETSSLKTHDTISHCVQLLHKDVSEPCLLDRPDDWSCCLNHRRVKLNLQILIRHLNDYLKLHNPTAEDATYVLECTDVVLQSECERKQNWRASCEHIRAMLMPFSFTAVKGADKRG